MNFGYQLHIQLQHNDSMTSMSHSLCANLNLLMSHGARTKVALLQLFAMTVYIAATVQTESDATSAS